MVFNEKATEPWVTSDLPGEITSVAVWRDATSPDLPVYVLLWEDGKIRFLSSPLEDEQIPLEGGDETPTFHCVNQIGSRLFAVGSLGRVYQRLGLNQWFAMDHGLSLPATEKSEGHLLMTVCGTSERSIYVAGSDNNARVACAHHWDGSKWTRVALPPGASAISDSCVESEKRVWFCGRGSAASLMVGSAASGFQPAGTRPTRESFSSVAVFNARAYLAGTPNAYSLQLDQYHEFVRPFFPDIKPELTDFQMMRAVDGVLWSLGSADIGRTNGRKWQRFEY